MLRAVLDANVVISALIQPKGLSGQILTRLLEHHAFTLVLSAEILEEIRRSLTYPKVRRYIRLSKEDLDAWLVSLELIAEPVEGRLRVDVVVEDQNDNKYIEAALEGHAQFLVTGDKHLLSVNAYEDIQIVTPRAFLALL